jgi:hypothetical protein
MEADQADEVLGIADIQVAAIVAVHGTKSSGAHCGPTGSPSSRPGGYPTCSRRCRLSLGRNGWPGWPTAPGYGSDPPPDRPYKPAL